MTPEERRYAQAAASMWREKIQHLAAAHHVPVRQEAIACLRAVVCELLRHGTTDDLSKAVSAFVHDHMDEGAERTAS